MRFLALDWKKAFDSINIDSLLDAVRRFGIPDFCLDLISAMLRHRNFYVVDQGITSTTRSQKSGIPQETLPDIVYADDTLLLATSDGHLQEFLSRDADGGKLYSMELHWDKFQLLSVQCRACIRTPRGEHIESAPGINYLGAVVTHIGLPGHELGRRIGIAKADFIDLHKVWKCLARFTSCSSEGSYLQNSG